VEEGPRRKHLVLSHGFPLAIAFWDILQLWQPTIKA
jgi:hypothetical protein